MIKDLKTIKLNRREFLFSTFCTLGFLGIPLRKSIAGVPEILDSRIGVNGDKTRFVLDLSTDVDYKFFILQNPNRIVIDFPQVKCFFKDLEGKGIISKYRFARFNADTYRVVLDLKSEAAIENVFTLPASKTKGPRLVVDLKEISSVNLAENKPEKKISAKEEKVIQAGIKKKIITLDPGHGGEDPGAIGIGGVYEKVLTLAAAKEAKKQLESTGKYKVYLTRDGDYFIKLWGRVQFSRSKKSDLFISIHADSLGDKKVKGAAVYTLAEKASDARAAKLAAKENKADLIFDENLNNQPKEVANILLDLKRRETLNSSKIFATQIVSMFKKRNIRLLNRNHRYAAFAVLKAPDVPSILIEMGFLSNRDEVKLLQNPEHRKRLCQGIVDAVEEHFA